MARRNPWQRLREGVEGPTVNVTLPREWAEELLNSLMSSLEMDGGMDDGGDMDDEDGMHPEPDLDDMGGPPDDDADDLGDFALGMDDDEPDMPAGDDSDEDEEPAPKKKGPGRPPGSKNKAKKKGDGPKKDDDDDSEDETDEATDIGMGSAPFGVRPQTALGESAFARAARRLASRKVARRPR